jgi:hypothetical protein
VSPIVVLTFKKAVKENKAKFLYSMPCYRSIILQHMYAPILSKLFYNIFTGIATTAVRYGSLIGKCFGLLIVS